jgi:hypothetical protein
VEFVLDIVVLEPVHSFHGKSSGIFTELIIAICGTKGAASSFTADSENIVTARFFATPSAISYISDMLAE